MKKLLAIALILSACGSNNSKPAVETPKTPIIDSPKSAVIETPKNPIIGTTKRLGNIEIAEYDFPDHMTWDDAKAACAKLGTGWRLPIKEELKELYKARDKVGGFSNGFYWSSSEYDSDHAWSQSFGSSFADIDGYDDYDKTTYNHVRAVIETSKSPTIEASNNPIIDTPKKPTTETSKNPIIGTPKILGNIEIAKKDFPEKMNWDDANAACAKLGTGWRLPTNKELDQTHINCDEIGGFRRGIGSFYWSSSEDKGKVSDAYGQFFDTQVTIRGNITTSKSNKNRVRAVRPF